ncbi:hypothetical protein ABEG74_22320 [Pantoea agglomerans]|uniref:hypothetical protein n=1 Tax=Pantoea TaxID=53335 RepID=UPI0032085018
MFYQYTDINAVKSIIENNAIRLTNIRFLNDKAEFFIGIKYLQQGFRFHNYYHSVSESCRQALQYHINDFLYSNSSKITEKIDNLYVASFSKRNDVLSQWRGYGMYSVEINLKTLYESNVGQPLYLMDCSYYDDYGNDTTHYTANVIDTIVNGFTLNWQENGDNSLLIQKLIELLCVYSLTYKHHSFTEEAETRLIYMNDRNTRFVEFRSSNDMLVPYITLQFPPQAITKITLGPVNDQLSAGSSLGTFIRQRCNIFNQQAGPDVNWHIAINYSQSTLKSR